MKVVIVGGYGVFGGRLACLLLGDGVDVCVAGRDLGKAQAFAARHGAKALRLDVRGDLSPLVATAPDFVVDASGALQTSGSDPYRLARFCLTHHINYLDFADDAGFAAGIGELDVLARAGGCVALAGASSLPAVSSAAVAHLSRDLTRILLIETTIFADGASPPGAAVMASALAQIGLPLRLWRGGAWRLHFGWSEPKSASLTPSCRRVTWLVRAPDLTLFPDAFRARSVVCRAGLEHGLMNIGLTMLGYLRRRAGLADLAWLGPGLFRLARTATRLSSGVSGLSVEVVGLKDDQPVRRRWQLTAIHGYGAYIPALPARALLRRAGGLASGARTCLADLTLAAISSQIADLPMSMACSEEAAPTLFQLALGETWHQLPLAVRRLHSVQDVECFSGHARVTRGHGLIAQVAASLFGFPKAGADVPLRLTKTRTSRAEIWERNFAGRTFRSTLSPAARPQHCRERFGAFTFEQELPVANGNLAFVVRRGWFLGLPLPAWLLPRSCSREFAVNDRFYFDVGLYAPLTGGLIVRYQGEVRPDAPCEAARD